MKNFSWEDDRRSDGSILVKSGGYDKQTGVISYCMAKGWERKHEYSGGLFSQGFVA